MKDETIHKNSSHATSKETVKTHQLSVYPFCNEYIKTSALELSTAFVANLRQS